MGSLPLAEAIQAHRLLSTTLNNATAEARLKKRGAERFPVASYFSDAAPAPMDVS